MRVKIKLFLLIWTLAVALVPLPARAENSGGVVISEVKLGGTVVGQPKEFVELYNPSDYQVDLTGWALEYARPAAAITDCQAASWKQQDSSVNVREVILQQSIMAKGYLIVELGMNDNTGGSLRLRSSDTVYDVVGWGSSDGQGFCYEGARAAIPANTKSIARYFNDDGVMVDTNNNANDFLVNQEPTPGAGPLVELPPEDVCSNIVGIQLAPPPGFESVDGVCIEIILPEEDTCSGVYITEILPNPKGVDTGLEYIELFNSNYEPVSLDGCALKVGTKTKVLSGVMQPGYQAFYDLTLPNAVGATVEFITATTEEVVIYPGGLKDDYAWALIDEQWQITNQPTPGAPNLPFSDGVAAAESMPEPCPEGKFRNPETNRCKNIEVEEGLKPCAAGQYRNPDTNRCRSIESELTSLKPCAADQYRNPETNRCRKIESATATLKPCAEGQERNPETNRCRKVAGASVASISDLDKDINQKKSMSYLVLATIGVAVLGYGAYEYRDGVGNWVARLRSKPKA